MSSAESDSDDLFYYSGRKQIQKQFEKRLSQNKQQQDIEIKSIFNSDDEEESLQPQTQQPRASSKRSTKTQPQSNNHTKKNRYDTNTLLEEFDKTINREMKRSASTPTKTEFYKVNCVMNSILDKSLKQIREELALQEAFYRQSNQNEERKEVDDVDDDIEVKSVTTTEPSQSSSSSIEILEGEEREKVMEDEYEGTDDKIVLKLRDVEDESKVVVIRMGRKCEFEELINSLSRCGFPGGRIMFDCSELNGKSTPEAMDMEDCDILDIEM